MRQKKNALQSISNSSVLFVSSLYDKIIKLFKKEQNNATLCVCCVFMLLCQLQKLISYVASLLTMTSLSYLTAMIECKAKDCCLFPHARSTNNVYAPLLV